MNEEIYEDLFKNVVINGHYPFEKLNEMKSYIKTLNIKIENLEQQNKKQQEIINKVVNHIESCVVSNGRVIDGLRKIEVEDLLDILKGVQNV